MEKSVPELEINQAVWETGYALAWQARAQGRTVPSSDILVFACAEYHGVGLEHDDEHFEMLAKLGG